MTKSYLVANNRVFELQTHDESDDIVDRTNAIAALERCLSRWQQDAEIVTLARALLDHPKFRAGIERQKEIVGDLQKAIEDELKQEAAPEPEQQKEAAE